MLLSVGPPVQDTNEMNLPDWDWLVEAEMLDIELLAGVAKQTGSENLLRETDR